MPEEAIQSSDDLQRTEPGARDPGSSFGFDIAMARIWIELFTRAALYAGAIGLIVGTAAALLLGD